MANVSQVKAQFATDITATATATIAAPSDFRWSR